MVMSEFHFLAVLRPLDLNDTTIGSGARPGCRIKHIRHLNSVTVGFDPLLKLRPPSGTSSRDSYMAMIPPPSSIGLKAM